MFPYYQWVKIRRQIPGGFDGNHDVHGLMKLWDERYVVPRLVEGHLLLVPEENVQFEYGSPACFELSPEDQILGTGAEPEMWWSVDCFRKLVEENTTYAMFAQRIESDGRMGVPYIDKFAFAPFIWFAVDPDLKYGQQNRKWNYWFAKREPYGPWKYWRGPAGYIYKLSEDEAPHDQMDDPLILSEDD